MPAAVSEYIPQLARDAESARRAGRARGAWVAAAVGAAGLLALIAAAPLLKAGGMQAAAEAVYGAFAFVCHQEGGRSFHVAGFKLAVCARCLGLYAAAPAGALLALASRPRALDRGGNLLVLGMAGLPTAISWLGEHVLGWPMTNAVRFAAALPLGAAVAWVVARTLGVQYTLSDARRG